MKTYEGNLIAKGLRFGIAVSRFNELLSSRLLDGALDALRRHDASDDDIDVAWVPGAWELPLAAKKMAEKGHYDSIICLGVIIRGSTPHFEYVATQTAKGVAAVSLETGTPVAFGVITADSVDQAVERAGTKSGNKGWQAALVAIEMANVALALKK